MDNGSFQTRSPILLALQEAEEGTTGVIEVHLSRRWIERDALARATEIFYQFQMHRTQARNAVLVYVNFRARKLAIIGDQGIHEAVGQGFWDRMSQELAENLRYTQSERAIALTVIAIGQVLKNFFPTL